MITGSRSAWALGFFLFSLSGQSTMMSQQNLVRDSEVVLQRTIHIIAAMYCIHFKLFFTDGFSKAAGSACQGAKQARYSLRKRVGAVFCVMRILRSQIFRREFLMTALHKHSEIECGCVVRRQPPPVLVSLRPLPRVPPCRESRDTRRQRCVCVSPLPRAPRAPPHRLLCVTAKQLGCVVNGACEGVLLCTSHNACSPSPFTLGWGQTTVLMRVRTAL
jgi:hypothetical protein